MAGVVGWLVVGCEVFFLFFFFPYLVFFIFLFFNGGNLLSQVTKL